MTLPYVIDVFTFESQLPSNLATGYYELKIDISDGQGNRSESHLNPGFLVGEVSSSTPYTTINLLAPRNKAIDAGTNPLFRWSALPANSYVIQISDTPDFSGELVVNSSQAINSFSLPAPLIADKIYYWRVRPQTNDEDYPWSVVNSFFTGTLSPPVLVQPQNNQTQVPNFEITFKWEPVPGASAYFIEVWRDEQLSDLALSYFTFETSYVTPYLEGGSEFFWRVQSVYFTFDFDYFVPSVINRFTTEGIATGIDDEIVREFYNYPNPFATQTKFVITPKKSGTHILSVHDAMGKPVRTFTAQIATGHDHQISWDGKDDSGRPVASGIYFAQLRTPTGIKNLKILIQE